MTVNPYVAAIILAVVIAATTGLIWTLLISVPVLCFVFKFVLASSEKTTVEYGTVDVNQMFSEIDAEQKRRAQLGENALHGTGQTGHLSHGQPLEPQVPGFQPIPQAGMPVPSGLPGTPAPQQSELSPHPYSIPAVPQHPLKPPPPPPDSPHLAQPQAPTVSPHPQQPTVPDAPPASTHTPENITLEEMGVKRRLPTQE